MKDEDKTREELIHDLVDLRHRVEELKTCLEERKQAEKVLQEQREELRIILDNVPAYIFYKDKLGRYIRVNKALTDRIGISEEDWIGKTVFEVLPNLAERYHRDDMEVIASGQPKRYIIEPFETPEGIRWAQTDKIPYRDLKGDVIGIIGLSIDITERKHAEEALRKSESKYRFLYQESPSISLIIGKDGLLKDANKKATEELGYSKDEVAGKPALDFIVPEQRENVAAQLEKNFRGECTPETEVDICTKDGSIHTILFSAGQVLYDDEDHPTSILVAGVDITDRKRAEELIKASLREKEILLREIHHRVKNNLQIISALLNLQSKYIKDNEAFETFRESQNRIKSMALIHDQLYQFKDLAKINMAEYIQNLTTDLFYSYGVGRDRIELKLDAQDVLVGVDTAIPCGLIINELVSNSLKHAFPDSMKGEICIGLRSNNDHAFTLTVRDSGIGFPGDLDFRNTGTLGLQLVITLVEQLEGTIELDRGTGTTFKITFEEVEL
ncbi:MAG: PAS domain S-box protein [Methanophagales archaeon ANME-1-THS]|nr:MAG: PAS domain S-box protein [Methanophagales archaeon ANME-1-THS]